MPEGPSIIILKEALAGFKNKKVLDASGYAELDHARLIGKKITDIKSWGKHLLISFNGFFLRIHLMMFGSYRINERKANINASLGLRFAKSEINFYVVNVKLMEGTADEYYDWSADVMSDKWSAAKTKKKLKALKKSTLVCDALLDQTLFSGSGNIIKNVVLFRTRIHPKSQVAALPERQLKALIKETRRYSFEFLKWKKVFQLSKHWMAYEQKECPRCHIPFHIDYLGKGKRITYYCSNCQELYKV